MTKSSHLSHFVWTERCLLLGGYASAAGFSEKCNQSISITSRLQNSCCQGENFMLKKFFFSSVKQSVLLTWEMQTSLLNSVCLLCFSRLNNNLVLVVVPINTQPSSEQYCTQMLYARSSGLSCTNHCASLLCLESNWHNGERI